LCKLKKIILINYYHRKNNLVGNIIHSNLLHFNDFHKNKKMNTNFYTKFMKNFVTCDIDD